jgi:hypothetical protein
MGMNVNRHVAIAPVIYCAAVLAGFLLVTANLYASEQPATPEGTGQSERDSSRSATVCEPSTLGSPYIPVDSWVYPAVLRLYSMDYIDHVYLGMRPWTRASLSHMLEDIDAQFRDADMYGDPTTGEAQDIYTALIHFLHYDAGMQCLTHQGKSRIESTYIVARGISGTPLRDSFHLGSTIINDYGRPYENGFNNYSGASGYATAGRFTFYVRGEFQGAPSATGYSQALANALSTVDGTTFCMNGAVWTPLTLCGPSSAPDNQATIPMGPIATTTDGRFIEAYVSAQYLNHVISFGKQDDWLGPGLGGGMAFSNNAENFYSFRINRIEPLQIPLFSRITGPFRYEFMVGALRGHTEMPSLTPGVPNTPNVVNPGDPWVHVEKISFRPTENLEFGFERTVIWGGKGHAPITIHTFLNSFTSLASPSTADKNGRNDPGARFGAFDFSYRLPFVRNWLTLYTDSEVHDDVSPIDAPRRASWRPGLYLSHVPGIPKLDIRAEAATTDPSSSNSSSQYGRFMYYEGIQKQGYTNQGQLFGDWIGREDKGGQAWITYHLSGNELLQVGLRNQKASTYFIPGGTTLNDINFQVVKRIGKDFEVNGNFALEHWKAPIYPTGTPTYLPGQQTVTTTTIQLTWFPERKVSF